MTGIFSDPAGVTSGFRGAAAIGSLVRDAISALTPRWLISALARDPRDIVVAIAADGQASLMTSGRSAPLGSDPAAALNRLKGVGAAVTITIDPARAFVRSLTVPAAALPRLREVLALDLERATPFKNADLFAAHRVLNATGDNAHVEHVVVKGSLSTPILDAARAANIPVKAIRIADASRADLNLLPPALRQRSGVTRALRRLTVSSIAIGASLAIGVFVLEAWRLHKAADAADTQKQQLTAAVAALRRETQDADRALQDAQYARARRLDQPLIVAVLEDLSRRLPNTTWLTDTRIDDGIIAIEGHSANAAELVAILSRSPFVTSAAFAAPITRDAQRGTERFQIRMTRPSTPKVSP